MLLDLHMDFTSIGPKKRQKYMIAIFIVLIFGIAFVVWNYFLAGGPESLPFIPAPPPEIKINFEVLENPILAELQFFGVISPFGGEIGRANPFIPY